MNLFPIIQQHNELEELLLESEGEITPEIEAMIHVHGVAFQEVAISAANVVRKVETDAGIIGAEIKRLQEMKKRAERAGEMMRETLKAAMVICKVEKIKTSTLSLSFRKSEAVVVEVPAQELPLDCQTRVLEVSPNKAKIKQHLDAGETVRGCRIETRQNLQIK